VHREALSHKTAENNMDMQLMVIVPEERIPELYELVATWHRARFAELAAAAPRSLPWAAGDVELARALCKKSSNLGRDVISLLVSAHGEWPDGGCTVVDPTSGEARRGLPADVIAGLVGETSPAKIVGCLGALSQACSRSGRNSLFFSAWTMTEPLGEDDFTEPTMVRVYAMTTAASEAFAEARGGGWAVPRAEA